MASSRSTEALSRQAQRLGVWLGPFHSRRVHKARHTHRRTITRTHDHGAGFDTCLLHSLARVCSRPCPCLCECDRKCRKMMLQLPDNNRRFAALPAQYSAACDRRLSLFGVSCRGIFLIRTEYESLFGVTALWSRKTAEGRAEVSRKVMCYHARVLKSCAA